MEYVESMLCQVKGMSCIGCCGHDFGSREEVTEGIKKNTEEYIAYPDKIEWMERSKFLRACGICRNVIFFPDGSVGCPLHPELNDGVDIREGHCDIQHLCKTAFVFNSWDDEKKDRFIDFLKSKSLDWYEYSMKMEKDILLNEFEAIDS